MRNILHNYRYRRNVYGWRETRMDSLRWALHVKRKNKDFRF